MPLAPPWRSRPSSSRADPRICNRLWTLAAKCSGSVGRWLGVYGLDLLGFGASSQPGNLRLDNRLWARQVHAFLQEVVQKPAVLVGHSLGGLVALTCSVFFPQAVRAVIATPLPDPTLLMVSPSRPLASEGAPLETQ